MFRFVDAAVLRACAVSPRLTDISWPDLSKDPGAGDRVREWLRRAWAVEEFASAIELASPSLARDLQAVVDGARPPRRDMGRIVLSTVRYLMRASTRATPFGEFAGVAPVRLGEATAVRLGPEHRVASRVDSEWLSAVITELERVPALRSRLAVVANNLVSRRDGRLVLACPQLPSAGSDQAGTALSEVSVRRSRAVELTMTKARSPVTVADLAAFLAAEFPEVRAQVIEDMLATLVAQRFLLSCLRPPMTTTSPLAYVVEQAERAGAASVPGAAGLLDELRGIENALGQLDRAHASLSSRRAARRSAQARMAVLHPSVRPLGADLCLDADLVLPRMVAREAEAAAAALALVSPTPSASPAWRDYHRRFLDRYGPNAMVAVREIVDPDVGLGYPAGFRGSPHRVPEPGLGARDIALLALAGRAVAEQRHEVVLDDRTVADLREDQRDGCMPPQPHTELICQLHAATRTELDSGRFRMWVTGVSRAAGTTTGRFLDLFSRPERDRMLAAYAGLPTVNAGALAAQVSCAPISARAENVTRSPRALPRTIALAEHHSDATAHVCAAVCGAIRISDLAVTGDRDGLYLVLLETGQPVEPWTFSAVEFARAAHPLQRFLCEISTASSALCVPFSWGAARHLPFLPRVRRGRAVLCPARWRLSAADLADRADPNPVWENGLTRWRHRYRVPELVWLGEGDRRLRLDLSEPAHRYVLRDAVNRRGALTVVEAPDRAAYGWCQGRPHELVLPLASTHAPTRRAQTARPSGRARATIGDGHLSGASSWLYAVLAAHPDRQSRILTAHLPDLLAAWPSQPLWWFIRYHRPEPHLRLRIQLADPAEFGLAAHRVAVWARRLRRLGLLAGLRFDTYYPENARFGGPDAMPAAETVFAADSAAAIAQLAAPNLVCRRALTAASAIDMVTAFVDDTPEGLRWCLDHFPRAIHPGPDRELRDLTIRLTDPHGQHTALRGMPGATDILAAWRHRHAALRAYHHSLAATGEADPTSLLPDLLHLHHVRMAGLGDSEEQRCLHLARAAALSWTTRQGTTV